MPGAGVRPPPEQMARARAAYGDAVAAKRWRTGFGFAVLFVAIGAASISGEVSPAKFAANIHRFPNYILSLVPTLTWANLSGDLAEWFWDLKSWTRLLFDTLLIAYLGTLLGFIGGFVLCFSAAG